MTLLSLYSLSLSRCVSFCFALSLRLLDALLLYSVAYLQTGMLMIVALQQCHPPPHPGPSLGLLLYTEGNKDTRRISVVCLTKWLPESERAMPMGSSATLLSSAQLLSRSPPPCLGFPKVRSLSGSSVDV